MSLALSQRPISQHLLSVASLIGFVVLLATILIRDYSSLPATFAGGRQRVADDSGPAPRRWEATILLPLADNQGQPFTEAEWEGALERLLTAFGGATLGQAQEGFWRGADGRVCREWVRPVIISFATHRLGEFRSAVHHAGQRLGQEALYVRFEQPRVELVSMGVARRP